jgi:hypothetical protein
MIEVALSAGALLAAIAAVALAAGAIGVIAQSRYLGAPIRWLWRTNVSGPISRWNRQIVSDVVDDRIEHLMHHRNGGSSLLDLAESVQTVRAHVEMLLDHDAERDTKGHRYGPEPEGEEDA